MRGKAWGALDALRPYLLAALPPLALFAVPAGARALLWVAFTWLATWPLAYFMAACGLNS